MNYIVLVDFSHMWHLCMNAALRAGPDYNLEQTTIVNAQGKLRTIHRKLEESGIAEYELIFVEDRPPLRKLALHPQYKPGRADLSADKNKLKVHLQQNGRVVRFCHSQGNEADDAISTLVRLALRSEDAAVVVVTGDADLHQLLGPRTSVLNPISREFVTAADVQKSYGVPPSHLALYKAIWGDPGDNIPNTMPRMHRQLIPFITELPTPDFATFKEWALTQKQIFTERCQELIVSGMGQAEKNWQCVYLDAYCPLSWD